MKKYKITAEYRARVHTTVEAKNEREAEKIAELQAEEEALTQLVCYRLDVEEVK